MTMAPKEQSKPLTSATVQPGSDDDQFLPPPAKHRFHRNKYIMCCGCFAALLLILAVIGIVLGFTIFHIKTPHIKIDALSFSNSTSSGVVIVVASLSIQNPNVASFKYSKATIKIYYHDEDIGEAEIPPGEAKAKDTMKMNMSVEIEPEKIDHISSLVKDLNSGALKIRSYTEIPGRVRILGFIKKSLEVKMNCSFTYNNNSQTIQGEDCDQHVEVSD